MEFNKLIVTIENVKSNGYIEGNVEPARLRASILTAQNVHLHNILGSALYDFYTTKIQDDGTLSGLSAVQTVFYEQYITPIICSYSEVEYIAQFQLSNIGVTKSKNATNEPAELAEIKFAMGQAQNRADFYAQRAKEFICKEENKTELEIYYSASDQNISPDRKAFNSYIYLPSKR